MSVVDVKVGNRNFQLACEDGQEGHLRSLAQEVDRKVNSLGKQMRTNNDSLLLLLTTLMMQDELNDFKDDLNNDSAAKNLIKAKDEELADVINTVTDYIEIVISRIEEGDNDNENRLL
jgi:cell division protein ZapA